MIKTVHEKALTCVKQIMWYSLFAVDWGLIVVKLHFIPRLLKRSIVRQRCFPLKVGGNIKLFWWRFWKTTCMCFYNSDIYYIIQTCSLERIPTPPYSHFTLLHLLVTPQGERARSLNFFALTPPCHNGPRVPFGPLSRADAPFNPAVVRPLLVQILWSWKVTVGKQGTHPTWHPFNLTCEAVIPRLENMEPQRSHIWIHYHSLITLDHNVGAKF